MIKQASFKMEESVVMIHVASLQIVFKILIVKDFKQAGVVIYTNSVILDLLAFYKINGLIFKLARLLNLMDSIVTSIKTV